MLLKNKMTWGLKNKAVSVCHSRKNNSTHKKSPHDSSVAKNKMIGKD